MKGIDAREMRYCSMEEVLLDEELQRDATKGVLLMKGTLVNEGTLRTWLT